MQINGAGDITFEVDLVLLQSFVDQLPALCLRALTAW